MRIKNRLSPYPILDNYGDDYVNSSINVDYDVTTQFSEIVGKITFTISNPEIENLLKTDKAEYLVHIECPATSYRKKISSIDSVIEFKLNTADLSKIVEIRTFVVLTKDVDDFYSVDFHPDYSNQTFSLKSHQILAIGKAMDYKLKKDDRDLETLPSVIQIQKMETKKKGSISVNTDDDSRIIIGLTEEVYSLYAGLGKALFKSSSFALVLLPTMIIVLQRMILNKDDSSVNSKHWFVVINTLLENNGFSLDNISIENDTLLTIAQSIFADPIEKSFKELEICSERM